MSHLYRQHSWVSVQTALYPLSQLIPLSLSFSLSQSLSVQEYISVPVLNVWHIPQRCVRYISIRAAVEFERNYFRQTTLLYKFKYLRKAEFCLIVLIFMKTNVNVRENIRTFLSRISTTYACWQATFIVTPNLSGQTSNFSPTRTRESIRPLVRYQHTSQPFTRRYKKVRFGWSMKCWH